MVLTVELADELILCVNQVPSGWTEWQVLTKTADPSADGQTLEVDEDELDIDYLMVYDDDEVLLNTSCTFAVLYSSQAFIDGNKFFILSCLSIIKRSSRYIFSICLYSFWDFSSKSN